MRVVSGKLRGRKLLSVPGETTRPILDRVKTALFDILRPEIAELKVLDLFAGSGSVGIEALSQGAAHCTFIDIEPNAIQVIKKNLAGSGLELQTTIRKDDAFSFLRKTKQQFDLAYVAPPQFRSLWLEALHAIFERPDLITDGGSIIVQIDKKEYEKTTSTSFVEREVRTYGNTMLVWYRKLS